jgi:hypothetical protein
MKQNNTDENKRLRYQALAATDTELISMYIKGKNKFALQEMKQRGIY